MHALVNKKSIQLELNPKPVGHEATVKAMIKAAIQLEK